MTRRTPMGPAAPWRPPSRPTWPSGPTSRRPSVARNSTSRGPSLTLRASGRAMAPWAGASRVSDYTEEMSFDPFAVQTDPLSLERLCAWVEAQGRGRGEGCGAVTSFLGVVRATHTNRRVRYLEYEAHAAAGGQDVCAGRHRSRRSVARRRGGDPPSNRPPGDWRGQRGDRGRSGPSRRRVRRCAGMRLSG